MGSNSLKKFPIVSFSSSQNYRYQSKWEDITAINVLRMLSHMDSKNGSCEISYEYNNAMVQWFDFPGIQILDRR